MPPPVQCWVASPDRKLDISISNWGVGEGGRDEGGRVEGPIVPTILDTIVGAS